MASFFVTLPSNALDEQNTTSNFRARLPQTITLEGNWEVGLVQFQYPYSWYNLETDLRATMEHKTEKALVVRVREGHYESVDKLCVAINTAFSEKIGLPLVMFMAVNGQVRYEPSPGVRHMTLPKRLAYMLGFANGKDMTMLFERMEAPHPPDMRGGIDSLYIYNDIIQPQIVGSGVHQVLDTVAVSGKFGQVIEHRFNSPHYVPVLAKQFDSLAISIKDDLDRFIRFNYGKCIIKLHFRKRR